MTSIASLVELLADSVIDEKRLHEIGITSTEAIAVLIELLSKTSPALPVAVVQVLLRLIESYLLSDNIMLDIARYPHSYLGRYDQHISARAKELLGVDLPPDVISHLRKCLTGAAATSGNKGTISQQVEREVFGKQAKSSPRGELRCTICGYHFQDTDLGPDRLAIAREFGLKLSTSYDPGRINDSLKPQDFSHLEFDHIVPEEGLGWTAADNIQIACQFCNRGRLIFRRCLEPLSTIAAGSLSAFPESRRHRVTRQVIVVSALLHSEGKCASCGITICDRELTAQLLPVTSTSRLWLLPWNVDVLCYRCIN